MDENQFWLSVWKLVAISFCVLTATIGGCTAQSNYLVARAVKDGADPIKASCAISSCSVETRLALGIGK